MKFYKKFSFWLPVIYLLSIIPMLILVEIIFHGRYWIDILANSLILPVGYIFKILGFSNYVFILGNIGDFFINLFFWFLIGLLIDKILNRIRKKAA